MGGVLNGKVGRSELGVAYVTRTSHRRTRTSEILSGGSVLVRRESIYYEAAGMAEYGPTVLFLHESGGAAATWYGQLTGLAQGARCLVPDLPGHGRSEGLGYATVAEYGQAVLGFLDELEIRWPVVVAGVCLGAAIAADLAQHAPDRVSGLILSGVCDGGRACAKTREAAARGETVDSFVQSLFTERVSSRLRSERVKRWRNTSQVVRHRDLTAVAGYNLSSTLQSLLQPVLLVAGEHDPIATPEVARRLAGSIVNAEAVTVPNAGCLSMIEQSAAFNRLAGEFLRQLGESSPIGPEDRGPGGYRRF